MPHLWVRSESRANERRVGLTPDGLRELQAQGFRVTVEESPHRILPIAAVNSGVLGTVLVERTQSFTLEQSIGFGLGSGLGYLLAVMLVTEAQNRLRSRAIPEAFRGLPITLIYIGVLALAIYGFTGHSVIL